MNTNKALTQNERSTSTMFTGSHESNEQNMEALQNRQRKQIRCHVILSVSDEGRDIDDSKEMVDDCRNKCPRTG